MSVVKQKVTPALIAKALTWALNSQPRSLKLTPGQRRHLRAGYSKET